MAIQKVFIDSSSRIWFMADDHEQFLELCAISTTGELTEDERKKLELHLAACSTCRKAKREYEILAGTILPHIARMEEIEEDKEQRGLSAAQRRLLQRIRKRIL